LAEYDSTNKEISDKDEIEAEKDARIHIEDDFGEVEFSQ